MRKFIFSVIPFIFLAIPLHADNEFGVKAGANYSTFQVDGSSFASSYFLSLFKDFNLSNSVALSVELNVTKRRGKLKNVVVIPYGVTHLDRNIDIYSYDFHVDIGYVEFPLLIKYIIPVKNKIRLSPYLGYCYSVPLGDGTERKNKQYLGTFDGVSLPKGDVQATGERQSSNPVSGYILGLSYNYKKWVIDFRCFQGNNLNGIDTVTPIQKDYKNRSIIVSLGHTF
ncbi:MAG: hypothetical protein B6244_10805 [Candidatus Cloacimonetes bacterium 4572_55]|nr:MAG: hypothetical protein B6244_10805 [Candidatus Cloacimonetes bacterium 4572_55]